MENLGGWQCFITRTAFSPVKASQGVGVGVRAHRAKSGRE